MGSVARAAVGSFRLARSAVSVRREAGIRPGGRGADSLDRVPADSGTPGRFGLGNRGRFRGPIRPTRIRRLPREDPFGLAGPRIENIGGTRADPLEEGVWADAEILRGEGRRAKGGGGGLAFRLTPFAFRPRGRRLAHHRRSGSKDSSERSGRSGSRRRVACVLRTSVRLRVLGGAGGRGNTGGHRAVAGVVRGRPEKLRQARGRGIDSDGTLTGGRRGLLAARPSFRARQRRPRGAGPLLPNGGGGGADRACKAAAVPVRNAPHPLPLPPGEGDHDKICVMAATRTQDILDRALSGARLSETDAVTLLEEGNLLALGAAANEIRNLQNDPQIATYIVDRNINYTNVCVYRCQFCAFYRPSSKDLEAYVLSFDQIGEKIQETIDLGGTGILLQGGV